MNKRKDYIMAKLNKKTNRDYQNGVRWGYSVGMNNVKALGKTGIQKSDAAFGTARKYAYDPNVKRTKTGKKLDYKTRSAFAGIADGIAAAMRKLGI